MKINRTALLAALDDAIADHRRQYDEAVKAAKAERAAERQEWLDTYTEAWRGATRAINAALRGHKPITHDMLPRNNDRVGYRDYALFDPTSSTPAKYHPPKDLVALREFLRFVPDDTVTSSSLRDVGLGRLGEIADHLGRAHLRKAMTTGRVTS